MPQTEVTFCHPSNMHYLCGRVWGVALLAPRTHKGRSRLSPPRTDYSHVLARVPLHPRVRGGKVELLGGDIAKDIADSSGGKQPQCGVPPVA
eukprot:scaffold16237_cov112-Isochrysis_galbana.AAC.1